MSEIGTDRRFLQHDAYADSSKLASRASLYQYRIPPGSLGDWVLGLVHWPQGARVLDVGCGPGAYLRLLGELGCGLRAVGADLSAGMASEASAQAPTVAADAARLPFPDGCFDTILAPHMLYHCPDIAAALAELRRVLRGGGTLVAVTNHPAHLAELRAVHTEVAGRAPSIVSDRFSLAKGAELLAGAFADVRLESFDGEVVVPEVEPLRRYIASMITWYGDAGKDGVLASIEGRLAEIIERDGAFRARTAVGAFVCR